ncbi:Major facilitator superfamily transporter [Colletotrichum higginsianum IMI 349063]|uniref:Major facilitator superfamily transporter n=3 Tax=Colletotrichum destructivum species complex TaxID=2707350 RepID=A0A1B7XZZ0_COLHI|nr:Major facilitator superfamily transporter [Colletotrichum higginsianum IMI 349063]OBR05314.1 Major facilitator superfamily transporter [Colletotrichum higginsianum IMI 349063]
MPAAEDPNKTPVDQVEHAPAHPANHRRDAAAELLGKSGASPEDRVAVTPADDARVLRRIDLVILPLMLFVYFLQGIDKSTLAYASVFGLIRDTGLVGDQYSWLGSVVYLAQLVMQFPLAWLLVKLPIGKFTSAMVAFWGITLSCMAAAHNFGGLLAARFFLGVFEASVAPSFVAITQMWWRRREQTLRISYWYAMNGFTNMFGSLITYGLGHISSPLKEYQIIFMFFGIITVVFSAVMFLYMPDSPVEAKFLNDHDKLIAIERLRMNQQGVMSREWRWDHLKESLLDIKTWFWFALVFSISIPSGGISTFGPLIVKSFGFDSFQTILFNIPFGFVQLVSTVGGSWIATKIHKKGPVIAGLCIPPIAGCVMLMVLPTAGQQAARLTGYYLISVYPGITPLIYSWSAANTAGDTKRKCTSAFLFVGQSVGNVIGPLLYKPAEAPRYTRGLTSNLALYCVIVVLVAATSLYLAFLNRSHSRRRVAMGKSAVILDTSLYSAVEAEKMQRDQAAAAAGRQAGEEGHEMAAAGEENAQEDVGARAFDNLTDLENEEFVFVF